MPSSHPEHRPLRDVSQGTDSPEVFTGEAREIRHHLGADPANGWLDEHEPKVLDVAARVVSALHDGLNGEISTLVGARDSVYRRKQATGIKPYTVPDLAFYAARRPGVARAALLPLAALCGCSLTPLPATSSRGLTEEGADVLAAAAAFEQEAAAAEQDGTTTEAERAHLIARFEEIKRELAELEARLLHGWRGEVAQRVAAYRQGADRG